MAVEFVSVVEVSEEESAVIPPKKERFPLIMLRRAWNNPEFKADSLSFYDLPPNASFGQFIRVMRRIKLEQDQPKLSGIVFK